MPPKIAVPQSMNRACQEIISPVAKTPKTPKGSGTKGRKKALPSKLLMPSPATVKMSTPSIQDGATVNVSIRWAANLSMIFSLFLQNGL